MINNDVLRSVRYMLDLGERKVAEITRLPEPQFPIEAAHVQAMLRREGEAGYLECPDTVLLRFLDGLISGRRGAREDGMPRTVENRITNNLVMKKLRVAFELRDADLHAIFESAGFPVAKPELSALFRQPGHKNYRACGDQMLRNFLKGLTMRVRGG